ncbi:hypothetical protein [Actinocrispum wychmicini]|uniref:hypothetical protein n=1 Tax=Actinocrispum wychmicini TaxID=1213861 RepID=UPI00104FFE37|nr:hypothetical protein [Actinocrispum wychmicini]
MHSDDPGSRLASALLDILRDEHWQPFLRAVILITLLIAGVITLVSIGPVIPLVAGTLTAAGTVRMRRSR